MNLFLAEMVGTAIILLFGVGVNCSVSLDKMFAKGAGWIVIAWGWAMGVTLGIYASGSISGAHLNPAVTLALAASGQFDWALVPTYIAAQMIGAMLGAGIVWLAYKDHFAATQDAGTKLGVFSTGPAIPNTVSNFLTEFIATFILLFCILAIGANKFTDGLNPFIVGMLILALGLSFGSSTGYALNPARDLGPRIMHAILPIPGKGDSNWGYAWIPVIAPICGGICGALVYTMMF